MSSEVTQAALAEMMENSPVKMSKHAPDDWCHLCGRRDRATVDVWFDKNAEHALREKKADRTEYIRICEGCANLVVVLARTK